MKNTHLNHPEDSICLGKSAVLNVLNWYKKASGVCSVKYDGAPAVVFGYNPENGDYFVGTKSVFNKVKVKINYTHTDIETNHGNNPKVANILHLLLECAPRDMEGIIQADYIGYTGKTRYTPNIITYTVGKYSSRAAIILAAHTKYVGDTIKDLKALPLDSTMSSGGKVHFMNTDAVFSPNRNRKIDMLIKMAKFLSNFVKYPTGEDAKKMQIDINNCIRTSAPYSDALKGNQLRLFNLMLKIKHKIMSDIIPGDCNVEAVIEAPDGDYEGHEGYVHTNEYGMFKLINRRVFSYWNFNLPKNW